MDVLIRDESEVRHSLPKLLEKQLELELRQLGPHAVVSAEAEGQRRLCALRIDVELARALEGSVVVIRGGVQPVDPVACLHLDAAQRGVLGDVTPEAEHRRLEAERFVDGRRNTARVLHHPLPAARLREQVEEHAGHRIGRRLMASQDEIDGEQHQELCPVHDDLTRVDGADQVAHEVVSEVGPTCVDRGLHVVLEGAIAPGALDLPGDRKWACDESGEVIRPFLELIHVAGGKSREQEDRPDRNAVGQGLDHVGVPEADHVVQTLVDDGPNAGRELLHATRGERAMNRLAQPSMIGAIEVAQHGSDVQLRPAAVKDLGDLRREAILRGREDALLGEASRIVEDRLHVVVASHDPCTQGLPEEDRLLLAGTRQNAMQLARIGTVLGMKLLGDGTPRHDDPS